MCSNECVRVYLTYMCANGGMIEKNNNNDDDDADGDETKNIHFVSIYRFARSPSFRSALSLSALHFNAIRFIEQWTLCNSHWVQKQWWQRVASPCHCVNVYKLDWSFSPIEGNMYLFIYIFFFSLSRFRRFRVLFAFFALPFLSRSFFLFC